MESRGDIFGPVRWNEVRERTRGKKSSFLSESGQQLVYPSDIII